MAETETTQDTAAAPAQDPAHAGAGQNDLQVAIDQYRATQGLGTDGQRDPGAPAKDAQPGTSKDAEAAAAEAPAEPSKPSLTANQQQAAKTFGYTPEEFAALPKAEQRRVEITANELRSIKAENGRLRKQLGIPKGPKGGQAEAAAAEGEADPDGTEGDEVDPDNEDAGEGKPAKRPTAKELRLSSDEDFDSLVAKFNRLADYVVAADERLGGIEGDSASSRQRQSEQAIGSWLDKLDRRTFSRFGSGDPRALSTSAPERQEWDRLNKKAATLYDAHKADGEDATIEQCLDEALRLLAPKEYEQQIANRVRAEFNRKKQGSAAPVSGSARVVSEEDEEADRRSKLRDAAAAVGIGMRAG